MEGSSKTGNGGRNFGELAVFRALFVRSWSVLCGKIARRAALGQHDGKVDAAVVASALLLMNTLLMNIYGELLL